MKIKHETLQNIITGLKSKYRCAVNNINTPQQRHVIRYLPHSLTILNNTLQKAVKPDKQ